MYKCPWGLVLHVYVTCICSCQLAGKKCIMMFHSTRLVSEEKYLEDRVCHVERHVAALALDLGALARKMARMRDKGDKIVETMRDFASAESGSLRKSLEGLGECLSALENSQQLQVCVPLFTHIPSLPPSLPLPPSLHPSLPPSLTHW